MSEDNMFEKIAKQYGLSQTAQRKIADMVKKYKGMDEEGKREFLMNIRDTLKDQLNKYASTQSNFWLDKFGLGGYGTLLVAVVLMVFVFVFFGYKLYKSLSERERKREEKKKNKQMKKKK